MPTYDDLMGRNWYTELYEEMTPKANNARCPHGFQP